MEAVQQSLLVRILLLTFRFKGLIHLPFLWSLNYRTASMKQDKNKTTLSIKEDIQDTPLNWVDFLKPHYQT